MKYLSLFCAGLLSASFAFAASGWLGVSDRSDAEFQESSLPLPELPDTEGAGWFDLYVSPTFSGKPQILLDSIHYAPDGSIRYILNNRSASGYPNVSAEGLLCITGAKLLGSEGSKLKTFAFADLANRRWITPRNSRWEVIGGKLNGSNAVRRVLYEAFCIEGRAASDELLRQRLRRQSGRAIQFDYSK